MKSDLDLFLTIFMFKILFLNFAFLVFFVSHLFSQFHLCDWRAKPLTAFSIRNYSRFYIISDKNYWRAFFTVMQIFLLGFDFF